MPHADNDLHDLLTRIAACRICRDRPLGKPLPHEPRPVLQASVTARILIAGQAPGTRVHASGRPFTDPSGDRLRGWLGMGPDIFYDARHVAILPMGFCFPGLSAKGADLPPRPECALAWRSQLMQHLTGVRVIVILGLHAMRWHLGSRFRGSLQQTIEAWRDYLSLEPKVFVLPHPSWRNNAWLKRNPWLETDMLPVLRRDVAAALE